MSPWRRPVIQFQYCCSTGWSRLSCWRSALRLAGVAFRPRIARAGSPGSAWVAANTTTETSASTRNPSRMRRTMNPASPPWRFGGAVVLAEPDGSVPMAERVEVLRRLARNEPGHLGAVAVDQVVEERDDVPTVVVFDGLHLVDDVAPFALVDLGPGLLVQA